MTPRMKLRAMSARLITLSMFAAAGLAVLTTLAGCDLLERVDEYTRTYTVTYFGNGADAGKAPVDSRIYEAGSGAVVMGPGTLAKTGHGFARWNTAPDDGGQPYHPGNTITGGGDNITLYAIWSVKHYRVTFNSAGGSAVASALVDAGARIARPADPVRTGYAFAGWYRDTAFVTAWNFGADTVTGDLTLYAKWNELPMYTVTFNSNGGSAVASATVHDGDKVTKPADPVRLGYNLAGWYQDTALTAAWNFAADTVTGNLTLYAKWIEVPVYTVTFDSGGGSAVEPAAVTSGTTVQKPADPTRAEYTFAGWYRDAAFATAWNFGSDTVTGDLTLYAKWNELPVYTVIFNSNGGSAVDAVNGIRQGTTISRPADPAWTGYVFAGWYRDAAFTTAWDFDVDTVTGDLTLYARWNPILHVYYDGNGATSGTAPSDTADYLAGEKATAQDAGTLANRGFVFDGWNTKADGKGAAYQSGETITFSADDITLYARWKTFLTYSNQSATSVYITGYTGTDLNVIIPPVIDGKTVTSIGSSAFKDKMLTSVEIPDTVTSIWASAFEGNELTEVIIPDSVTTLASYAFYRNHLTSVTLGKGLTSISDWAFYSNSLTSIVIPVNVASIASCAFGSNHITSVTIGSNVDIVNTSSMGYYGDTFRSFYAGNERKAGVYTQSGGYGGTWSWVTVEEDD